MNLVLYHDNCPDGFTAAWACWKKFGDKADYRGVNYSDPVPADVDGKDVYLVDFSFSLKQMEEIADRAHSVTVFDHHKTAAEALNKFIRGNVKFDMNRSGAGITWDELHGGDCTLVNYVEDCDLWHWHFPSSREISEYIFSVERTFPSWDLLAMDLETRFDDIVDRGLVLLRAKRVRVATICQNARFLTFNGIQIPMVNTCWDMSEIGEYLCEQFPQAPAAGYYFDRKDKRQWGFRSRGEFDVSVLCKQFGGGGHKNAAGFESEIGWLPEV